MAISVSDQESSKDYDEGFEEEDYSTDDGTDQDYDSGTDPSYSIEEDTRSKLQNLSIKKKSRSSVAKDENDPEEREMDFPEVDDKSYDNAQKILKAGKLEKLKVDQCKVYLRKHGLRLSGKKDMLIKRIKEHLDILNGGGEKKYPVSSFILNCKGDACTGDVVMFEQKVYDMYNVASRSASGPTCGTRIVAGRIVKESYGAAKQQHTFTIEVLWSKGEKPLPPLHPLLIKGRNLYRLKTLRQRWEDEGERQKVLMEKHSRGSLARSDRGVRIQEKEKRERHRANRILKKDERNKSQSQLTSTKTMEIRSQQPGSSRNSGMVAHQRQLSYLTDAAGKLSTQTRGSGSVFDLEKPSIMSQQSGLLGEPQRLATQPKQSGSSVAPREKGIQLPEHSGFSPKARRFQSEYQNFHVWEGNQNQIHRCSVQSSGIPEVQLQKGDLEKPSIVSQRSGYLAESQQLATQPKQSGSSVTPREKRIQLPEQSGFSPNFKARSFRSENQNVHERKGYQNQIHRYSQGKKDSTPREKWTHPKQSGSSVTPREERIQHPEQSGFSPNFKARSFQSEFPTVHEWKGNQNQIHRYSSQNSGISEVRLQKGGGFYMDYRETNYHMNEYQSSIDERFMTNGMRRLPETSYHRHQLKSMNNWHAVTPPWSPGVLSQQLCRYFAQGRCYHGENCKFLHEVRDLHGGEEMNNWHPVTPPRRPGFLSQQLCRHHARGRCYHGENCKFLHEPRDLHGAEEMRITRWWR